ncbi:hypothetical protein D9M72_577830 [compost metagenome]
MRREPVSQPGGQDGVDAEVPEHELHERRHISVIGHVSCDHRIADAAGRKTDGEQDDRKCHRQGPRAHGDDEGHLDAMQQHGHVFRVPEDRGEFEALHDRGSFVCGLAVCSPPIT